MSQPLLLAGDVGATKVLIGVFEHGDPRPRPLETRAFATTTFADLTALVATFLSEAAWAKGRIASACFGVAGPVVGSRASLTNVAWRGDATAVSASFGIPQVVLLNDLQAMALAAPVLEDSELHVLQAGRPTPGGNVAIIAAGTGLGEAALVNVDGRYVAVASEGGHADFAARTERDIDVLRALTARLGRVQVEDVVSGRGLANLHQTTHRGACSVVDDPDSADGPRAISGAALERTCQGCIDALDVFVEAYGAETGNLALRSLATGGVYVGGGIAPKILPALTNGRFLRAFLDKAPMHDLLTQVPVRVILETQAGLLGAAVGAARVLGDRTTGP